tara:strand:- start:401 stop:2497 length:2097 start_codon:yes stop_codon:yes gene_type:complete
MVIFLNKKMISSNIKKIFDTNISIKLISFFVIIFTLELPINSWEKYVVISLYILGFFFTKINKNKKLIFYLILSLILFNIIKFFLPSNIIIEKHAVFTPFNENANLQKNIIPKNIYETALTILEEKNSYFLEIDYPNSWSFSADSFWSKDGYSRKLKNLNFNNRYDLNIGQLNHISFYKPNAKNSYELYYPIIFSFEFKNLIANEICWKGILFSKNNNDFEINQNKEFSCDNINNINLLNNKLIGLDFDKSSKLSIKLKHHGLINKALTQVHLLSAFLLILYLFILFKFSFGNIFTLTISNSLFFIYLYELISKGLPSGFSELIYLQRGNDGLTHFKIGREILENIHNYDFYSAIRGGSDVFYFMPGMRYANTFFMSLFGDSLLGYFIITSFIPFVIYILLRKIINKNWSIILLWCFLILPFFESFGFFQFYYSKLAILGFGEPLSYFFLFLGIYFLIQKNNHDFYSINYLNFFVIGLFFFFCVSLRPNYIILFIAFFIILGFYNIYLLLNNSNFSNHKFLRKYFLLIFGFSPILLVTLHNWYFGKQIVLLTSASMIVENLRVPPYIWLDSIINLFKLEINKQNWTLIFKNVQTWINYYEFWLILVYLNLWVGVFRKNNYFLFRILSFSLIIAHIPYLFYAGDHRYTYGLWTICLIIFFKDFKEFYFQRYFYKNLKRFKFEENFSQLFYKILEPIKTK